MHVVIHLKGERGAKYRISIHQLHEARDGMDGTLWELQRWREAHRWHTIASGQYDGDTAHARVLAGWLLTAMPGKLRGEINPIGGL
jgi:hypothetical protein